MTIYVDPLFSCQPSRKWPYFQACHMTTDGDIAELHRFAQKLGLQRKWFQGHHKKPKLGHYDLTASKRKQAIQLGAIEITREQLAGQIGLIK